MRYWLSLVITLFMAINFLLPAGNLLAANGSFTDSELQRRYRKIESLDIKISDLAKQRQKVRHESEAINEFSKKASAWFTKYSNVSADINKLEQEKKSSMFGYGSRVDE